MRRKPARCDAEEEEEEEARVENARKALHNEVCEALKAIFEKQGKVLYIEVA